MKLHVPIMAMWLILSAAVCCGAQAMSDQEMTRQRTQHFKEQYRNCLTVETQRVGPRTISARDLFAILKRACSTEAQKSSASSVAFLTMVHPKMPKKVVLASVDHEIALARADAVKWFIEMHKQGQ